MVLAMLSPKTKNDEWLTPKQVALILCISLSYVYKLIDTNQLPAHRIGVKLIRIKRSDLNGMYRPASETKE